jgi:hypothetical protein
MDTVGRADEHLDLPFYTTNEVSIAHVLALQDQYPASQGVGGTRE